MKGMLARLLTLAVLLYGFFLGLEMMQLAFKLFGKGFAEALIETTSNPFVGLFVGVLATSLVQSSSSTTSMTVAMVSAGALTIEGAIPIIMGANIGTSVTNTIVALAHVNRTEEFRRAFAGATVHDFFNWMAVLLLFPLELALGFLGRFSSWLANLLEGAGGMPLLNPLRAVVRPVADSISDGMGHSPTLTLILGVTLLFLALRYLVVFLRKVLSGKAEAVLHRTLFRSVAAAILAGILMTVMVQSSSITTSVLVPLIAAGVITLEQAFPFTIGANIGTTVTALMASLALGSHTALTVAFAHLMFNVSGALLIYLPPPTRRIPLALARWMGDVAVRSRPLAVSYILIVFFGIPLLLLLLSGSFGAPEESLKPALPADASPASSLLEPPHSPEAGAQRGSLGGGDHARALVR